jgi:ferredoxin
MRQHLCQGPQRTCGSLATQFVSFRQGWRTRYFGGKPALLVYAAAVIIVSEMSQEKTADREAAETTLDCRTFEVTLVTPYGSRLICARAGEHIWDEAKAAGITLPAICHQGRCLTCAGELLEPGRFDPSDAVSYYPQDREAGFILLCTAKARSNLRIRTHMQTEMRAYRKKIGLPAPYA